jgi:hypothetical protein
LIELQMVGRMARRALAIGPVLVVALAGAGAVEGGAGTAVEWGVSGAIGIGMTLGNLWLSAAIIGRVAERSPQLLLAAGLATFALGLLLLTAIAFMLQKADVVFFPVTGFVLIASHLGLVLWDAAGAYRTNPKSTNRAAPTRK